MSDVQHFIDGKRAEGASGRWSDVFNPATGERVRRVALGGGAEVDAAVQAAAKAFPGWAATPPLTRARILFKARPCRVPCGVPLHSVALLPAKRVIPLPRVSREPSAFPPAPW